MLPEPTLPTAFNAVKKAYPDKYDWALKIEARKVVTIINDGIMSTKIEDELIFDTYNIYFRSIEKDKNIARCLLGLINDYHAHYCKA